MQVDFALAEGEGGRIEPRLIELQAFPALYAFQWLLDSIYRQNYDISPGLAGYFDGLDHDGYAARLGETIVADCDPKQVVLLERQKTRPDFAATERLLGVGSVNVREVAERGRRLSYRRDGREVPIRRLYNQVIFDELVRRGLPREPLFTEPLDAVWVGTRTGTSVSASFRSPSCAVATRRGRTSFPTSRRRRTTSASTC